MLLRFTLFLLLVSSQVSAQEKIGINSEVEEAIYKNLGRHALTIDLTSSNTKFRISNIEKNYNYPPALKNVKWVGVGYVQFSFIAKKNIQEVGFFWQGKNTNYLELLVGYGKENRNKERELQQLRFRMPTNSCEGPWELVIAAKTKSNIFIKKVKVGAAVYDCGSHS